MASSTPSGAGRAPAIGPSGSCSPGAPARRQRPCGGARRPPARLLDPALGAADHRVQAGAGWGLRQYNGQAYGQQTRFNHHIVLYARRLEDRVAELEARLAALERERDSG